MSVHRLQWRNGVRGAQSLAQDVVDDRGQYRIPNLPPGEYLILAYMFVQAPPQPAPTYYPGTPSPALATPIALGISEERTGINVQVNSAVMSTVTGTVKERGREACSRRHDRDCRDRGDTAIRATNILKGRW